MDKESLEKIKVALRSLPYEKFSNENMTQNHHKEINISTQRDNLKENKLVTAKDCREKTIQNKHKKRVSQGVTNKEVFSYSRLDDSNDEKVRRRKNITKYLVPIIVISPSAMRQESKTRKRSKKVKFLTSEVKESPESKHEKNGGGTKTLGNHSKTDGVSKIKHRQKAERKSADILPAAGSCGGEVKGQILGMNNQVPPTHDQILTRKCPSVEELSPPKGLPLKDPTLRKSHSIPRERKCWVSGPIKTIRFPDSEVNPSRQLRRSQGRALAACPAPNAGNCSQLQRRFSARNGEPEERCECNPWARQYGRHFCSQKRTTQSGILAPEGIQGKSILKDRVLNQMVKETLQEHLWLHGVGCRYRRGRFRFPWFIQADVAARGPLYFMVLPGLYVGNFRDSKDKEQLNRHNISHILAIHDNARKLPCNNDKEYLCIIASDSPGQNLTQFFPVCNDFIHTARLKGGNILIHCLAGMSRSVTVAVVYVMCVTSLRWRDALKAVQGARNVANPNVGFLKQLQEFEKERLQEERRRIREKYPDWCQKEDDEQMVKELLTSYYHYMSVGEMCDGNCQQGVACPRGLCNQPRSCGIFRRNSREPYSRSSSPLGKRSSSLANMNTTSPRCSPEHSRNPSPTSSPVSQRLSSANTLTPPSLPYQSQRTNVEPLDSFISFPESPSRGRKNYGGPLYGQPTPPGSPSRSYGYYTSSPNKSPTSTSPSNTLKGSNSSCGGNGGVPGSPSRSLKQGKIIHCPSTPSRRNANTSQLTPPPSPLRILKNKNRRDGNTGSTGSLNRNDSTGSTADKKTSEQGNKRNARMSFRDDPASSSPQKRITRLCQRETKSLDLSSPPGTPFSQRSPVKKALGPQKSVPNSPAKQSIKSRLNNTRSSPSRFCQAVTRLLPQIVALNGSSRLCKNISKPFVNRTESSALYVDEKGRSSLKRAKNKKNDGMSSSSLSSLESRTSTNAPTSISFEDEDEEARIVIFELCKNIQKLPKETEINYEPSKKTVESDLAPEGSRTASLHATIDISSYTNSAANASIIINPIFSLENKYEADSLCNNKAATLTQKGKGNFSAFLEDDIIYVQTTESENNSSDELKAVGEIPPAQNNNREASVIVPESVVVPILSQMDIRINPCDEAMLASKPGESDDSSDSDLSPVFQRDFSICKRNSSSFKPPEEDHRQLKVGSLVPKEITKKKPAEGLGRNFKEKNFGGQLKPLSTLKTQICPPLPPIHAPSSRLLSKSSHMNAPRPLSGPPPPLPPRKGMRNPSKANPLTPPPVPPRNMKPQVVQSPPPRKTASSRMHTVSQSWKPTTSSSTKPSR